MYLRAVELRDWRSYRSARFDFPRTEPDKNVILIRAPNEYGKTSFFEAVTLGLFGREGLTLIPRARAASAGSLNERLNMTYSRFLESTLHRRAIEDGRASCMVTLEAEDDDGTPLIVTRKWYFRPDGAHKLGDDALEICEGVGRTPVAPPANTEDKDAWYRDFIARRFVPSSLAEFFLFDGEQVQRYAQRGMGEQVRRGIEGLLGLPVLKSLRESLASYAQARRSSAAAPSDTVVKAVEAEIARLEQELSDYRRRRDEAATLLPALQAESEQLAKHLAGRGEGTIALVADLIRDEERNRTEAQKTIDMLMRVLAEDVALALAGADLRSNTISRLESEAKRERWEAGRNAGNANLDRFSTDLWRRLGRVTPPLDHSQSEDVVAIVREAWEALWHPAPEGCSEEYLHGGLRDTTRAQAIDRLIAIGARSSSELVDQVKRFRASVDTAESKKRERLELEQSAPEAERLSFRLREVSEQVARLQLDRDEADRSLTATEGLLAAKRQELGRHVDKIGRGRPALRRAKRADEYSDLVADLLREAVPTEVGAVATAMTKAWKSMAHMSDRVDRIEITEECEVKMLNSRGEDLHLIDKSAGASQVFTQALITAITAVSGRDFPFVVDTPLARLSREQRIGVLKTFTNRSGQVILLSTDEEVVDDKLEAIRERIIAAYALNVTFDSGVAVTSVVPFDVRGRE